MTLKWTGPMQGKLLEVLSSIEDVFEVLPPLLLRLGKSWELTVTKGIAPSTQLFELIKTSVAENWIDALVLELAQHWQLNEKLQEFAAEVAATKEPKRIVNWIEASGIARTELRKWCQAVLDEYKLATRNVPFEQDSISKMVQYLWGFGPTKVGHHPFVQFVKHLLESGHFSADIRPSVGQWLTESITSPHLQLPPRETSIHQVAQQQLPIIVAVEQHAQSFTIYRWRIRDGKFELLTEKNVKEAATVANLHKHLFRLIERELLTNKRRIELYLPMSQLELAIDQWRLREPHAPWGKRTDVSVGLLDRQEALSVATALEQESDETVNDLLDWLYDEAQGFTYELVAEREQWSDRWQTLNDETAYSLEELATYLEQKDEARWEACHCLTLLNFRPLTEQLEGDASCIYDSIKSGIPLMIWSRSTAAVAQLRTHLYEAHKAGNVQDEADIAAIVKYVRTEYATDANDIGRNLTYVMDNPTRQLPYLRSDRKRL